MKTKSRADILRGSTESRRAGIGRSRSEPTRMAAVSSEGNFAISTKTQDSSSWSRAQPSQNLPDDGGESLADWERERDRIEADREADRVREEAFWNEQRVAQQEADNT